MWSRCSCTGAVEPQRMLALSRASCSSSRPVIATTNRACRSRIARIVGRASPAAGASDDFNCRGLRQSRYGCLELKQELDAGIDRAGRGGTTGWATEEHACTSPRRLRCKNLGAGEALPRRRKSDSERRNRGHATFVAASVTKISTCRASGVSLAPALARAAKKRGQ